MSAYKNQKPGNHPKKNNIHKKAKVWLIQFSYIPARDKYKRCYVRASVRTFHIGNVLSARKFQSKATVLYPVFNAQRNVEVGSNMTGTVYTYKQV